MSQAVLESLAAFVEGAAVMQVRKSDMSTYFEDLAVVRPTTMTIIPRLANMMYDKMMTQLEHSPDGDEHAKAAHKQARTSAAATALFMMKPCISCEGFTRR